MESLGIGGLAALGMGLVVLTLVISVRRSLGRRRSAGTAAPAPRIEALAAAQADLAARLDALATGQGAPEERLQAMAGQMLGLIRDKNATMETALAGLDQLRGRMRTLEQMGAPAEARALLERLEARLDEMRSAQAAGAAALEARIAALESPSTSPVAELAERLTRLHAQKDSVAEAVLARLAKLEAALAAQDPKAALDRFAGRLEDLRTALDGRIAALETPGENPFAEISAQMTRLYAQKDATVETVFARLAPMETRLGAIEAGLAAADPKTELDRFAERLETVQGRLAALETPGENPFAEISEQLTRLYAQKDATVETVLARLAPLEARLSELAGRIGDLDPQAELARFAERLEAVQAAHAAAEAALRDRLAALEAPGENPFAEISEQLTRLYAQKDATVATVFARLAPLEAKLAEMAGALGEMNPQTALDRFAERLEAVQGRVARLEEPGENPFAEISEQLTRLYAQKDTAVETVLARLAPLEARLSELAGRIEGLDPQAALDRFTERLEAVQGRVARLEEPGENPFAEISEQLTRLYAQKDATVETVFARLAPLEARLSEIEARDPQAVLDRFAERLEAVQGRLAALEEPGENPFAEISDQLTRLYAQKDATVETVFARLAPLEAKLGEIEAGLAAQDPQAALDRFAERLEGLKEAHAAAEAALRDRLAALEEPGENPFAEISEQLTRLYAQKDATVATVFARLAPLETKLGAMELQLAPLAGADPRAEIDGLAARIEALAWAQGEVAAGLAALKAAGADAGAAAAPLEQIADQITRLYAQKDAGLAALLARLAPLEARLAEIEDRPWDPDAGEARAQAQAIATEMIAARAAAEQTGLFADRLALLEASLPRLSAAQATLVQALGTPGRRGSRSRSRCRNRNRARGQARPGTRPAGERRIRAGGDLDPAAAGLAASQMTPAGRKTSAR